MKRLKKVLITVVLFGIIGMACGCSSSFFTEYLGKLQKKTPDDRLQIKFLQIKEIIRENFLDEYSEAELDALLSKEYPPEYTEEEKEEALFKEMIYSLGDPYSAYFTKEEFEEEIAELSGNYCGIGALLSQNMKTMEVTIVRPFANSPAAKAGILPGDIIKTVDGQDVTQWESSKVVAAVKGEAGTSVKISLYRPTTGETYETIVIRDFIETETVVYRMLDETTGYIAVSEFEENTDEQFGSAYLNLQSQGMKKLVIDLRDNPGGYVDTAVNMVDLFIDNKVVVSIVDKKKQKQNYYGTKGCFEKIPMVVLVNGESASASEIMAGALQDYGLAKLVGVQSFGKGIVQGMFSHPDGSVIKLTFAKYYTPNGRCIHGIGLTPDVVAEQPDEVRIKLFVEDSEDVQLQKALEVLKNWK